MNEMQKPLQIVNASAGSGKTFNLVYNYLKLLFGKNGPTEFASIVAMTFTNKAALEMKTRIIEALEKMAYAEQFDQKERKYEVALQQDLGIPVEEIHARSKTILKNILHQYEDFMVLTIDKFNLKLLRSFSRDLDISGDFEVIVDEKQILNKILDQLLSELGSEQHATLSNLALNFSEKLLDDDRNWNFQRNLEEASSELTKEKNADFTKALRQADLSIERYHVLLNDLKKLQAKVDQPRLELKKIVDSYSEADFKDKVKYGSNTYKRLVKIANDAFDQDPLLSDQAYKSLYENEKLIGTPYDLRELLDRYQATVNQHKTAIYRLESELKTYHTFALLKIVAARLAQTRKEEQILLISEFNALLSALVQNVEAPFIYDRLGYRYRHFLLDEFQDTSRMQWMNLVPLVHEFLGNNQLCFVVGDPKQSIYRFKNGLAEQFVCLPQIYNPEKDPLIALKSSYFDQMGEKKALVQNWRSGNQIVAFNNRFFESLRDQMPESTRSFYESIRQEAVSKREGYVEIQPVLKEDIDDTEIEKWIEAKIKECLDDGFSKGDITLLGRDNRTCSKWANMLTSNGHKVVSADSLLVDSDLEVKVLIAYFYKRLRPSSDLATKKFISRFLQYKKLGMDVYNEFVQRLEKDGKRFKIVKESDFYDHYFQGEERFYLKFENLYDLGRAFCELAEIDPLQNHYVHHLLDILYQFDLNNGPDLLTFLQEYENRKNKMAVQIPAKDDAIEVMTYHKSKGLEFPIVLMPSAYVEGPKNHAKILKKWEDDLHEIPISKNLKFDELSEEVNEEISQTLTDSINTLYVGFTRPVERLYALIETNKTTDKSYHLLDRVIGEEFAQEMGEDNLLRLGKKETKSQNSIEKTDLNYLPSSQKDFIWFPQIALKQGELLTDETNLSEAALKGTQFHLLMSEVNHIDELTNHLDSLIIEGKIDIKYKHEFLDKGSRLFKEILSDLYQISDKILSEKTILIPHSTEVYRPDKIVIRGNTAIILDFKTGEESQRDRRQVLNYQSILEEMDFTCKAALVYTEKDRIMWLN